MRSRWADPRAEGIRLGSLGRHWPMRFRFALILLSLASCTGGGLPSALDAGGQTTTDASGPDRSGNDCPGVCEQDGCCDPRCKNGGGEGGGCFEVGVSCEWRPGLPGPTLRCMCCPDSRWHCSGNCSSMDMTMVQDLATCTQASCVSPTEPICDPDSGRCVACLLDVQCPPGTVCMDKSCTPGCNQGHPCVDGGRCEQDAGKCE